MTNVTESNAKNRVVTLALRPPRLALLFLDDSNWQEWARLAINTASRYWGGGGFAFVPYSVDGTVNSKVMTAVQAFDPDYVGLAVHDGATWFAISPDRVRWNFEDDLDSEAKARSASDAGLIDDFAGNTAASLVIAATSALNYTFESDHEPNAQRIEFGGPAERAPFLPAPRPGAPAIDGAVAAAAHWEGSLSLYASARSGIAPSERDARQTPTDESLLDWLINPDPGSLPAELLWYSSVEYSDLAQKPINWFDAASPDLSMFRNGYAPDSAAIVIGDTAADFALAVLFERMLGYALWLTPADIDKSIAGQWRRQSVLHTTISARTQLGLSRGIAVTTASLSDSALALNIEKIRRPNLNLVVDGDVRARDHEEDYSPREPILRDGLLNLSLVEHLATAVPVPVEEYADGTVALQVPIVTPIPSAPIPRTWSGGPAWLVDVSVIPQVMPSSRGLHPKFLVDSTDLGSATLMRSSRAGITFHAASHGFVSAGTVLASQLAMPRIQFLGISRWVQAMSQQSGYSTRASQPGRWTDIAASQIGGRTQLMKLMSGEFLPVLREFVHAAKTSQKSSEVFPCQDGVVLDGRHHLLSMFAIGRLTPTLTWRDRRAVVDQLLQARLLTQGLVLDCQECGTVAFFPLGDLSQRFECRRCGAENALSAERWKHESAEPTWFYDIHPALLTVMASHGDDGLLAASALKKRSRLYVDTSEVEFLALGTPRPEFEIDLIALTDDGISVVEAKSSGSLGTGSSRTKTIKKRFEAARLIRADRVVFTTTAKAWSQGDIDRVEEIRRAEFSGIAVEWLSGLAHS